MQLIKVTPIVKNAFNITCKENDEIEITFEALQEDISPSDQFDMSEMKKFQKVLDNDSELQYCGVSHNWFCAHVTVKYKGFEGEDYLGACSYKSYDDFVKRKDDYFVDMVSTCVDSINAEIEARNAEIRRNLELRKALIFAGKYPELMPKMKRPVCIQ